MNLFFPYLAQENTLGAREWVSRHGMKPSDNINGLATQMQHITDSRGDSALYELKDIHPDKELFSPYTGSMGSQNSCGCSGYSNANGQTAKDEIEKIMSGKDRDSKIELMIMAGTILVALALIMKK